MGTLPKFKHGEQAQAIINASRSAAPLHSHLGESYLSIPTEPAGQTVLPLHSPQAELWMTANFLAEHGCAPSRSAMRTAIGTLEAEALHHSPRRTVGPGSSPSPRTSSCSTSPTPGPQPPRVA